MIIYIIFGGCIILAVCWILFSLSVKKMTESDIFPLIFDIMITIIVLTLSGIGTYVYRVQWKANEKINLESQKELEKEITEIGDNTKSRAAPPDPTDIAISTQAIIIPIIK